MTDLVESDYSIRFGGLERLVGSGGQERLRAAHVAVVGVGGVGSWSVEALARCGVGRITMIDFDEVCLSNVNRQVPAMTSEAGRSKVAVLRQRVLGINPECRVDALEEFFTAANAPRILATRFDFVIDAIDHVLNKCLLISECRQRRIPIITTGAAGGRLDPSAIRVTDLARCSHDRLLQRVRKVLRAEFAFPTGDQPFEIEAVYSPEPMIRPERCEGAVGTEASEAIPRRLNCETGYGSAVFVTGAFGFVAASRVVSALAMEKPKSR